MLQDSVAWGYLVKGRAAHISVAIPRAARKVMGPQASSAHGRLHAAEVVCHHVVYPREGGGQILRSRPHLHSAVVLVNLYAHHLLAVLQRETF